MTTSRLVRTIVLIAAPLALGVATAGVLGAQGLPPTATVPRNESPALRVPVRPSRPPAAVAPAAAASRQARAAVDSGPSVPKSPGMPVDSAKPAPAVVNALDPRRAPAERQVPPAVRTLRSAVAGPAVSGPTEAPEGATARCKDGTFLLTPVDVNSCLDRGGLVVAFPQRQLPKRPSP